jgi:hypothetical protein
MSYDYDWGRAKMEQIAEKKAKKLADKQQVVRDMVKFVVNQVNSRIEHGGDDEYNDDEISGSTSPFSKDVIDTCLNDEGLVLVLLENSHFTYRFFFDIPPKKVAPLQTGCDGTKLISFIN